MDIPDLIDANKAGTTNSHKCTLILTQGVSAKIFALSGLDVIGNDFYGVYILHGNLLNVREATQRQILENVEINNLAKIIGLKYEKKYFTEDDLKSLRYGKVMILANPDVDGSYFKGLVINFFHTYWGELLRLRFLENFLTPAVKASTKKSTLLFYSIDAFQEWEACTKNYQMYKIRYYKWLGEFNRLEAKECFKEMESHRILFKHNGIADDDSILITFSIECLEKRKNWLDEHIEAANRLKLLCLPERYLNTNNIKEISYSEFINLDLIRFFLADSQRKIPSMVDGFTVGQRKVVFTCFKRNNNESIQVSQLAGSVAEMSSYYQDEKSVYMIIIQLAQNYIGSNNINLLQPLGQFGTRLNGGKDHVGPFYLLNYGKHPVGTSHNYTKMSQLSKFIFHSSDDPFLTYEIDNNQKMEPQWYIPIIPMILVNGANARGTVCSTKIYNHNPRDIIKNIRRMIAKEDPLPMHPWYKNFKGTIKCIVDGLYLCSGNVKILPENKIEINELPIETWTQSYKENVLEPLLHGSEQVKAIISDYKEYHTETTVKFIISFAPGEFERIQDGEESLYNIFKLTSTMCSSQMYAFDHSKRLQKYSTSVELLKDYYQLRLEFYRKRKEYLVGQLTALADRLSDQARFIVIDRELVFESQPRKIIVEELLKRGYRPDPVKLWQEQTKHQEENIAHVGRTEKNYTASVLDKNEIEKKVASDKVFQNIDYVKEFDYLLGMPISMLTEEQKNILLKERDEKLAKLAALTEKTIEMLYLEDLEDLEKKLDEVEEQENQEELKKHQWISKKKKERSDCEDDDEDLE